MSLLSETHRAALGDRLRDSHAVMANVIADVIGEACRRFPSQDRTGQAARLERLIQSGAWTDAALALIELELPQWKVRRLTYDEGEWHCALSRERELPDWLDQSIESHHGDLALAILSAFVEARRIIAPSIRPSVPPVRHDATPLYEPTACENFS